MLWRLDLDEGYFRIYDSKRTVAGYFDPDYGDVLDKKDSEVLIEAMLREGAPVRGGTIMVPLAKFRLFDTDLRTTIPEVEQNVARVMAHLGRWRERLGTINHIVGISHTDQDMLTVSFPVDFGGPVPLDKKSLLGRLGPVMDGLQESGLL